MAQLAQAWGGGEVASVCFGRKRNTFALHFYFANMCRHPQQETKARRSMHPAEQKLRTIARYTVSAQKIPSVRHYIIYTVYSWTNDVIAAMAGIGITFGFLPQAKAVAEAPVSPFQFGLAGGILALTWGGLKLAATRDDGIKRATLMRSCNHQIMVQRGHVYSALDNSEPLGELSAIYKEIRDVYD